MEAETPTVHELATLLEATWSDWERRRARHPWRARRRRGWRGL